MLDPSACFDALRGAHRLDRWCPLPLDLLVPEQRVRDLCAADLCGNWGRHPQCPPLVGTLDAARSLLGRAQAGLLAQTTYLVDPSDQTALRETRRLFAEALLALEAGLAEAGAHAPLALVGGPCALCALPCPAREGAPCPSPERARTSLEALGVDVMAILAAVGWDTAFHPDRVSWTGAVLWSRSPTTSGTV